MAVYESRCKKLSGQKQITKLS